MTILNSDAMSDWLHCNTCFKQPGDGRPFYLTSCGHIYCEMCSGKGWKEKCLLCDTNKPSALLLSSKLQPPADMYFSEPIKMMKHIQAQMKHIATEMDKLIAVAELQHKHRKRFVNQLQKAVANQKAVVQHQEQELKAKMATHFETYEREQRMKLAAQFGLYEKELRSKVNGQMEQYEKENTKLREENKYLQKLLSENHQGHLRSPSGDRVRSPAFRAYGSPYTCNMGRIACSRHVPMNFSAKVGQNRSAVQGSTLITPGRVSVRTPPSGGKMGVIPSTPTASISSTTPKSAPHHIFDANMMTP